MGRLRKGAAHFFIGWIDPEHELLYYAINLKKYFWEMRSQRRRK
jgi:hypothetical protein